MFLTHWAQIVKYKYIDNLKELLIIQPSIYKDERGSFFESFNSKIFNEIVGRDIAFTQDNQSYSKKSVLRGLHSQKSPFEQGKLVRVLKGQIFDVAVDIRVDSSTFGLYHAELLSEENNKQFWIPEGFAHGFLVMSDDAIVQYKTNKHYNKDSEVIYNWLEPKFSIKWPTTDKVILSDKDSNSSFLK